MRQFTTAIFCTIFLFCTEAFYAQSKQTKVPSGYEIHIATENLVKQKLILFYTYGTKKQEIIVDSITVKNTPQKITFKNPKPIIGTIYSLKLLANPKNKIDLAVDNGDEIKLQLNSATIESMQCTGNTKNIDFLNYQNKIKSSSEIEKKTTIETLLKKYPASVLGVYLQIEKKLSENQPTTETDKIAYQKNFFNKIDTKDKRLLLMPNLFKLLFKYVQVLPLTNENYTKSIDFVLSTVDCKSNLYKVYASWFMSNLFYFEDKNLENTLDYFTKNYIDGVTCDVLTDSEKSFLKNKVATNTKLPNNSIIPDFEMQKDSITSYKLSDIYSKNDLTFLTFFSPTCHHCKETLPKVKAYFEQLQSFYKNSKIQVVSVLNDDDDKEWQSFLETNKLQNWINLKNTDPSKKYQTDFNAYSNPNFYLLDKKGKIILKSFNESLILEFVKTNLKR